MKWHGSRLEVSEIYAICEGTHGTWYYSHNGYGSKNFDTREEAVAAAERNLRSALRRHLRTIEVKP